MRLNPSGRLEPLSSCGWGAAAVLVWLTRVVLEAGTAVSPQGQLIRVDEAQCACLNHWIQANESAVIEVLSGASELTLYVVLSYLPCPVDEVLIPGEPCRDEQDAKAFSRITDEFELALAFAPPEQIEVDAMRAFANWLREIVWLEEPDSDTLRQNFANGLLAFNDGLGDGSAPRVPPGLPPSPLNAPQEAAEAYLNLALRLWVTRIRPHWLGTNADAAGHSPSETRVLLGELTLPLTVDLEITSEEDVTIVEDGRPILPQLQWSFFNNLSGSTVTGEEPMVPSPTPLTTVVAAGRLTRRGRVLFESGGLNVIPLATINFFYLTFDAFTLSQTYAIRGMPIIPLTAATHIFEPIPIREDDRTAWQAELERTTLASRRNLATSLGVRFIPGGDVSSEALFDHLIDPTSAAGVMVRIQDASGGSDLLEFDVEISAYSGA